MALKPASTYSQYFDRWRRVDLEGPTHRDGTRRSCDNPFANRAAFAARKMVSRRASGNPPSLDARRFWRDAQLKLVEQNDCKEKDCEIDRAGAWLRLR